MPRGRNENKLSSWRSQEIPLSSSCCVCRRGMSPTTRTSPPRGHEQAARSSRFVVSCSFRAVSIPTLRCKRSAASTHVAFINKTSHRFFRPSSTSPSTPNESVSLSGMTQQEMNFACTQSERRNDFGLEMILIPRKSRESEECPLPLSLDFSGVRIAAIVRKSRKKSDAQTLIRGISQRF